MTLEVSFAITRAKDTPPIVITPFRDMANWSARDATVGGSFLSASTENERWARRGYWRNWEEEPTNPRRLARDIIAWSILVQQVLRPEALRERESEMSERER
jgi:hypothetical protein